MTREPSAGWLFLRPDDVPARWRERAQPAMFIPLHSEETAQLLRGEAAMPALDPGDEQLARLAAEGHTVIAMARELGVSRRTVQRHLAALRERLGVGTALDLAVALATRGFRVTPAAPPSDAGQGRATTKNTTNGNWETGASRSSAQPT